MVTSPKRPRLTADDVVEALLDEGILQCDDEFPEAMYTAGFRAGIEAAAKLTLGVDPTNSALRVIASRIRALLPAEGKENPRGD